MKAKKSDFEEVDTNENQTQKGNRGGKTEEIYFVVEDFVENKNNGDSSGSKTDTK